MRKRVQIAAPIVVIVILATLVLHRGEPSYEEKTLSDWVVAMHNGRDEAKARAVVRQLGTNSIPLLLDWLRREDRPTLRGKLGELKNNGLGWLMRRGIIKSRPISIEFDSKSSYRALGKLALQELGSTGKAAIPALIRMLGDKKDKPDQFSEVAGAAYLVLPKMSPESIQPLVDTLSCQDTQVWILAAEVLGNIGPDAKAAIPVLEGRLEDKGPMLRVTVADIIGKLGGDRAAVVLVLAQSFREGNWDTRTLILPTLVQYKEHAKAAVPALIKGLNDTADLDDPTIKALHWDIMTALMQIDPEAAAKAGVR